MSDGIEIAYVTEDEKLNPSAEARFRVRNGNVQAMYRGSGTWYRVQIPPDAWAAIVEFINDKLSTTKTPKKGL